jgi:hypothetical protein
MDKNEDSHCKFHILYLVHLYRPYVKYNLEKKEGIFYHRFLVHHQYQIDSLLGRLSYFFAQKFYRVSLFVCLNLKQRFLVFN